jgi:hypothetical protein
MTPIWTLKLGAVAVTLAASAGFWHYVTGHVYPVKAPLKPKVAQPVVDTPSKADTGWDMSGSAGAPIPAPAAPPVVKTVVVVEGAQQQVRNGAALGASWVANQTGQRPVQATRVS